MRKIIRIGFPILCVGIILVTFWMLADIKEKAESNKLNTEENSESDAENTIENNVENSIENEVEDKVSNQSSVFATENEISLNKAIYILEKIVDDENIYYTDEGMEEERYIVAVRDKETTQAKKYYIVDLETGEAEIYY